MEYLQREEVDALHEVLDDEYKAWATYDQVIRDFGEVSPFTNIRESETRHIGALSRLFKRYDLPVPPNTWPAKVERFVSVHEACAAAVEGEIENELLYRRLLPLIRRPDIRTVFDRLREASQKRHLPAFQRCLARVGACDRGGKTPEGGSGHRRRRRHRGGRADAA